MFDSNNPFRKGDSLVDAVRSILSGKPIEEKKMDPVGQEDDDVDNDGDVDKTDKYLKNRRKAISKAMKESEDEMDDEEDEDEDENGKKKKLSGKKDEVDTKPSIDDQRMNSEAVSHVYFKGGSIGDKPGPGDHPKHGKKVSTHDDHEEAKAKAKRMNKRLSPGEKKYYKMKYHVVKETMDDQKNVAEAEMTDAKNKKMMRKALGVSKLGTKHAHYTTAYANNGDFVVKDGGGRIVGRIAKGDLNEAETKFVIKHKKTKQVLSTHNNYNDAKDELNGISDKNNYLLVKQTKKDAALANRNTMREEVNLGEMSDSQMKKREEIVKSMKKKMPDFKKKYGDRAKDVMYATATKMAMKEGFELTEEDFEELDEATYSYKAATFNGNVVKGIGKTKEAARKDAEDKAKALGSTIRKRLPEETDLDEARRGRPRKDGSSAQDSEGLENIQMQLRKSISMNGQKDVEFANGKKLKVPASTARRVLSRIDSMRQPKDKQNAVNYIMKSPENLNAFATGKEGDMDPDAVRKKLLGIK